MLRGRPLYDNAADAALFTSPPEWELVERGLARDLNTLIVGERGVGKTTLLRQIQLSLRKARKRVVFVDANAISDPLELSRRIRETLVQQPSGADGGWQEQQVPAHAERQSPGAASQALSANLNAIADVQKTTILVDGSASGEALYGIFGRMRDAVWQMPHTWAVAIDQRDQPVLLKPPADAFFDNVVRLKPWSAEDLGALLWRRLSGEDAPVKLVRNAAAAASGNPREALRAVNDALIHDRDPAALSTRRGELQKSASQLGRSHGLLMAELLDRGQASPSDDDVQAALGLTRSRLTHLLRQLLEHQLVVAETDRQASPGRPRTIYRPALPAP